jgi:diaminobutyrate-2-oxoglutarate transaminase
MPDGHMGLTDGLESEVRWYSRQIPVTFDRAKGALLWDENGRSYVDFLSGCGSLNYGHNPESLKLALLTYVNRDGVVQSMDLHTIARQTFMIAFHETILQARGLNYRMMFCGPTGSDAVEAALKLSRKLTGRRNIVSFTDGFHGMTLGALAATGASSKRRGAGVSSENVIRMPYDGYFGRDVNTIELISRILEDPSSGIDPPAAFLLETVQGEGGLNTASISWLEHLSALARKYGSLLIIDDIQAGCGRTGTFFSFECANFTPDLVCLSKSLSGSGLPLSMVLIRPELDAWEPGEHTGTFRGQNYAFVTGTAALKYWQDPIFLSTVAHNIDSLDEWLVATLRKFRPVELTSKGRGLMRGIACADAIIASKICSEIYQRGILLETSGARNEVIKFMPPLNIETDLMLQALKQVSDSIGAVINH